MRHFSRRLRCSGPGREGRGEGGGAERGQAAELGETEPSEQRREAEGHVGRSKGRHSQAKL